MLAVLDSFLELFFTFSIINKEFPAPSDTRREARSLTSHRHLERETHPRAVAVGDLALILPSILPLGWVYGKPAVFLGQSHPAIEIQALVVEEPADGESRVF